MSERLTPVVVVPDTAGAPGEAAAAPLIRKPIPALASNPQGHAPLTKPLSLVPGVAFASARQMRVLAIGPWATLNTMDRHEVRTFPQPRRTGITIAAAYCIFAGLSEVWVGITGNWMGLLSKPLKPSFWTALVGVFYVLAGISLLPKRRTGAILGIVFILLEVLGRVHLVRIGTYPSRGSDFIKSVVGGTIALLLVVYLITQWRKFDEGRPVPSVPARQTASSIGTSKPLSR